MYMAYFSNGIITQEREDYIQTTALFQFHKFCFTVCVYFPFPADGPLRCFVCFIKSFIFLPLYFTDLNITTLIHLNAWIFWMNTMPAVDI